MFANWNRGNFGAYIITAGHLFSVHLEWSKPGFGSIINTIVLELLKQYCVIDSVKRFGEVQEYGTSQANIVQKAERWH